MSQGVLDRSLRLETALATDARMWILAKSMTFRPFIVASDASNDPLMGRRVREPS